MMEVIYKEESYRIMGSCFEVYRELGCGFLEAVYQECLEIEFTSQGIPFVPQAELGLTYKDRGLKQKYFADLICMDKIVVEVKAVKELTDAHRAQVHNYLKATGLRLALLVNFGHYPMLEHERVVR
jgi:GxxExxY protein